MVEQRSLIVGHLLIGELVRAVGRFALIAAIHCDHSVVSPEIIDLRAKAGNTRSIAMDHQKRLACPINFVVKCYAVVHERLSRGRI